MTKLRIVKRENKYIVQIGINRWWTNKIKWMDKQEYHKKHRSGWQPYPLNHYPDFESADRFCEEYFKSENILEDKVIKTYNTTLYDRVYGIHDIPKVKDAKETILYTCSFCNSKFESIVDRNNCYDVCKRLLKYQSLSKPKHISLFDMFKGNLPNAKGVTFSAPVTHSLCLAIEAYVDSKIAEGENEN